MKSLLALIPYIKKYKSKTLWGCVFVLFANGFDSIYPLIIGAAIDSLKEGTLKHSLLTYALAGIGSVVLRGIFLFLTRQNLIIMSREVENDIRHDFFAHLQKLPKSFYNTRSTGDIMAHATNDIGNIRNFIGPGIMYSIQTFTRIVFTLIILFNINPLVTILALAPLPLFTYIVYKVGKATFNRSLRVYEIFSNLTTKAQECLSGIRVIKSYAREKNEAEEFDEISLDYQKKNLLLAKVQSFSFPMMFLLTSLSVIVVIYFGGKEVMKGNMTIGNISSFLIYLGQLTWPMIAFGWIINLIQRAAPSMNRIMDIIRTEPEISNRPNTNYDISQDDIEGEIEFKDVSFKYPLSSTNALENINLKIHKGTTLGIIGPTGSGKSTLINLIPRIWDATSGYIYIDGHEIRTIPLEVLRKSIGIVPQESFLFSNTIGNNIAYSSDTTYQNLVEEASRSSGLQKDIENFPKQYSTILGERGITLSGGQKQRTSLARAIYMKPKILILDDSMSAVDTKTEEEILNELKTIMKGRTSIIITHRISTVMAANNIVVLINGEIKEEGTHNELIAKKGLYFDIHQKQLLEEEISGID